MKIIDNIKQIFGKKESEPSSDSSPKSHPTGYEVSSYGSDLAPQKKIYLEAMHGWVYAAVSAIADEIGAIQIKLFEIKNDNSVEEVKEHPSLDLLFKVNDFTTKFDHFWLTDAYLELAGESPWFVNKNNKGEPIGLFFLRPDLIQPLVNKEQTLVGYKYRYPDGSEIQIPVDDIIFLKYPNPANPLRGKGIVESSARTIDIDNEAEKWNFNFFKNEARPDYAIKVKNTERLSKEQRDKLKKSVEKMHKGTNNAHKLMVLFGDLDIQTLGFNHKDMDFSEMQKFTRDKILSMFRVPKAIVALTDGVNFANAKTAQYIFAKYTIKPKFERIIQQLNEFYLPMFKNTEKMFLDYVSPVPEDKDAQLKEFESGLKNGYFSINEVRAMKGMEPVDGGDTPHLPANLLPLGESSSDAEKGYSNRIRQVKAKNGDLIKFDRNIEKLETSIIKLLRGKKTKKLKEFKTEDTNKLQGELSTKDKELFWEAKSALYNKFFPKILKDQIKIFESQQKSTIAKLNKQKRIDIAQDRIRPVKLKQDDLDVDDLLLDEPKEEKKEIKFLLPLFTALYLASGTETFDLIGLDQTMNMNRKVVKDQLKKDSTLMAKEVTKTTNDQLKSTINEGLKAGEGVADIQKRINTTFKNAKQNRSRAIANTETIRYSSNATEQAFKDSGVVKAKQWQINPDACPICQPLQGKFVNLGQNFFKKGDSTTTSDGKTVKLDYADITNPPVHPNCFIDPQIPIYTSKGWKQIGKIEVGDLVLTHKNRFRKVTQLHRTPKQSPDIVDLEFKLGDGKNQSLYEKLTITNEHPVLSNGKWVAAKDIKVGDKLQLLANRCTYCDKKIPWFRTVCSLSCNSKAITKRQWSDPKHRERMSKLLSDRMFKEWKENRQSHLLQLELARKNCDLTKLSDPERMKKLHQACGRRNYGKTWIEEKVGWLLDQNNIKFDKQYPIPQKTKDVLGRQRYYFADFKLQGHNILIECDGDYWHGTDEAKKRDAKRQKEIEELGYMVLRFTQKQIMNDLESVLSEIQRVLSNHNNEFEQLEIEVQNVNFRKVKKNRTLYNFSVEEDESYIAKGFVVHNCRCTIVPVFIESKNVKPCHTKTNQRVVIREKIVKIKSVKKEKELDAKLKEAENKIKEYDKKISDIDIEKENQGKLTKAKIKELDELKGLRETLVDTYNVTQSNE